MHRTRIGIYQRQEGSCRCSRTLGGSIRAIPIRMGTRTIPSFIQAMAGGATKNSMRRTAARCDRKGVSVPLFNKLAPGKWQFMGHWQVMDGDYATDEEQDRMVWKFTLQRQT